jgi:hypothetical protein
MPSSPVPGAFPLYTELIPGELSARVWLHDAEAAPCWSYTSEGLQAHGQAELILTVHRGPGEADGDFPREPLEFFKLVLQQAKAGQLVYPGDLTMLGGAGLLGHRAVTYVTPHPFEDVQFSGGLAAILLKDEEVEAARAFGITRVLSRLGQAHRHYPYPPWCDRARPSLPLERMLEDSILAQLNRIRSAGMTACLEGERVVLRVLSEVSVHLQNQMAQFPPDEPLALLTELEPSADGCFVWKPGQQEPKAITAPDATGARLSGCFLALVPGQSADGGQVFEDGLMMLLRDESWSAIREGVRTLSPVEIPPGAGFGFSLEWLDHNYISPINGSIHSAAGGWRSHAPEEATGDDGPTEVQRIVLLTPEHELQARLKVEAIASYIDMIKATVATIFGAQAPGSGQDLMVQFEIQPGGHVEVNIASRPGVSADTLQQLYERLGRLACPAVAGGPVTFQVIFAVWGGTGMEV